MRENFKMTTRRTFLKTAGPACGTLAGGLTEFARARAQTIAAATVQTLGDTLG
jgi:hypothetical protein